MSCMKVSNARDSHVSRTASLTPSTWPKRARAAARACASGIPPRTFCSVSMSMWNASSRSRSCSRRSRRKSDDRRVLIQRSMFLFSSKLTGKHAGDGTSEPLPVPGFLFELPAPGARQLVELRLAFVFRAAPFRGDQSLLLEPVQRGIQGALVHLEDFLRDLLYAQRNAPTVHWPGKKRLEDQQVQSSL